MRDLPRQAVFVLNYPSFGGPHNRVRTLQTPLSEVGWNVTLILPTEPGNAAGQLIDAGVHVRQVPLSRFRRVRDPRVHLRTILSFPVQVLRLRRVFRQLGADVVVLERSSRRMPRSPPASLVSLCSGTSSTARHPGSFSSRTWSW